MILLFIFIILLVCYSLLIFYYWKSWKSVPLFQPSEKQADIFLSVLIPARDEEENIGNLLAALLEQTYPPHLYEIIVIDDHSTDSTAAIAKTFRGVKVISLENVGINSYKKMAIEKGIELAKGKVIITTDADCIPPARWLETIASFSQFSGASFIVAPVVYRCNNQPFQVFQAMDFLVLQGITAASVHRKIHAMCNGANLAYKKELFHEVGGFSGIDKIASGDDMLLMQKISKKFPDQIRYLKSADALVQTQPMPDWSSFFNQRIRWASKARLYQDNKIKWVLILVYLFNLSFLFLAVAGFIDYYYWGILLAALAMKTLVEMPFFISVSTFFRMRWTAKYFFAFQPIHIFYTIVAGLLGQLGKYEWKGRRVK